MITSNIPVGKIHKTFIMPFGNNVVTSDANTPNSSNNMLDLVVSLKENILL